MSESPNWCWCRMTAEIAILNRNAVVLATDSAMTSVVSSASLGEIPKISHNANKLFALSTSDPLAVMIYNDSTFGSVPWETIIKEFRQTTQRHSTVEEHAYQFIDHLRYFKDYIPEDQSIELIRKTRDKELDDLCETLTEAQSKQPPDEWDSATVQEFINVQCERRISEIQSMHDQADLDEHKLRSEIEATVSDWYEHVKSKLSVEIDDRTSEALLGLVIEALKVVPLSASFTGIVVAGFGNDQHFPALSHYVVENVMGGDVKVFQKLDLSVQADGIGHVVPFAQQALPIALLGGLPPDYRTVVYSAMSEVIELLYGYLLGELKEDLPEERWSWLQGTRDNARDNLLQYFEFRLTQDSVIKDTDDISRIVGYLSKEEIAELAEALVHLTQLRLLVSQEPETVGGPIDVAVISKGDGLIWTKRKHYFEQELNPRYFRRIQQE